MFKNLFSSIGNAVKGLFSGRSYSYDDKERSAQASQKGFLNPQPLTPTMPQASPTPNFNAPVYKHSAVKPTVTKAPTYTPAPTITQQYITPSPAYQPPQKLDIQAHRGVSTTPVAELRPEYQKMIWNHIPNQATQSAVAIAGENAEQNPKAKNVNADGTVDYGLTQLNNKTFSDLMRSPKYANQLKAYGINKIEDTLDPDKSIFTMKLALDYERAAKAQPFAWYYGWQNKGYNMFPDQSISDVARKKYPSGSTVYFKLLEKLRAQGLLK